MGPYDKNDDVWEEVGNHLKSTTFWYSGQNGTDDFGFAALPGGSRSFSGDFGQDLHKFCYFWNSNNDHEFDENSAGWIKITGEPKLYIDYFLKEVGQSARCIAD